MQLCRHAGGCREGTPDPRASNVEDKVLVVLGGHDLLKNIFYFRLHLLQQGHLGVYSAKNIIVLMEGVQNGYKHQTFQNSISLFTMEFTNRFYSTTSKALWLRQIISISLNIIRLGLIIIIGDIRLM